MSQNSTNMMDYARTLDVLQHYFDNPRIDSLWDEPPVWENLYTTLKELGIVFHKYVITQNEFGWKLIIYVLGKSGYEKDREKIDNWKSKREVYFYVYKTDKSRLYIFDD